jgi:CysZ protein
MIKEFKTGVFHFILATRFLIKHKLAYFYLFPILVSIVYNILILSSIFMFSRKITQFALGKYIPENIPQFEGKYEFLNFISRFSLHQIIAVLVGLLIYFISSKIGKYIILILLSPVFSILSEKIEEKITGVIVQFKLLQFLKDIKRGILIALRNLCIELALIGLFTLIGFFIGPFALLFPILIWVIGAYFYGFSMLDYTLERRKMTISESVHYMNTHKPFVIGNGVMYALIDLIPIVGIVFSPINAVVGATTGILELEAEEK